MEIILIIIFLLVMFLIVFFEIKSKRTKSSSDYKKGTGGRKLPKKENNL